MNKTIKDSVELLKKEVEWCNANKDKTKNPSAEYKRGFIQGIEQAIYLLTQKPKVKK
jgi:hypothetical protein